MTVDKFIEWFGNLAKISNENSQLKTPNSDLFVNPHPYFLLTVGQFSYFRTLCAQGNLPH
jgi:hypothetical protein